MTRRPDGDFWPARAAGLAKLLDADGLAIVLPLADGSYASYVAHNVDRAFAWSEPAIAGILANAMTRGAPVSLGEGPIALADGRVARTVLVAPVLWADQAVAALAIARAKGSFTDGDATVAERVAVLVALDLRDTHALWRSSQVRGLLEQRARAASAISAALASERDPDRLLEKVVARIAEAFGADGVSVMLEDGTGTLTVRAAAGAGDAVRTGRRRFGEGISGYVAQSMLPLWLTGRVQDQRFAGNDSSIAEAFVIPLRTATKTVGVLNVKYAAGSGRGDPVLQTLVAVADDLVNALVIAVNLRRADLDRRHAIVLYELSRLALAPTDGSVALRQAVILIGDALHQETVTVWEVRGGSLHLRAASGDVGTMPTELAVAPEDTIRAMLDEGRARRLSARSDSGRPPWVPPAATDTIAAPIAEGGAAGVLVLSRSSGTYADVDVDLAAALGRALSPLVGGSRTAGAPAAGRGDDHAAAEQEVVRAAVVPRAGRAAASPREEAPMRRPTLVAVPRAGPPPPRLNAAAAAALEGLRERSGLAARFWSSGTERPLRPAVEAAALGAVEEALRDVAAHAGAEHVEVAVRYEPEQLVLTVEDDDGGVQGGDVVIGGPPGPPALDRVREQIEAAGGQLLYRSEPARGTIVRAQFEQPYLDD
ncbi:MAG: GAF domain-containing protein [Candidatus Limnocylindria bacterium]